jgi:hypothetical protein
MIIRAMTRAPRSYLRGNRAVRGIHPTNPNGSKRHRISTAHVESVTRLIRRSAASLRVGGFLISAEPERYRYFAQRQSTTGRRYSSLPT